MLVANVVTFCALVILWLSCEVEAGTEWEIVGFIHVPSLWSEVGSWVGRGEYPHSFISLSAQEKE